MKQNIIDLLLSENLDDIRLGFIIAKKQNVSVREIDRMVAKIAQDTDSELGVYDRIDKIATEYITYIPEREVIKIAPSLYLIYKEWKNE